MWWVCACVGRHRPGSDRFDPPVAAAALSPASHPLPHPAQDEFSGGGTYFPAVSSDVDGLLIRPKGGYCLMHDGNIKHAGNEVRTGDRFILVGFYNADGRDRAGEEEFFGPTAREEARLRAQLPPPVQTVYFTTAVAAQRTTATSSSAGFTPVEASGVAGSTADGLQAGDREQQQRPPPQRGTMGCGTSGLGDVASSSGWGGGQSGTLGSLPTPESEDETASLHDCLAGDLGGGYWRSRDPPPKALSRGASPATCLPTWMQVLQGRWRPAAALAK